MSAASARRLAEALLPRAPALRELLRCPRAQVFAGERMSESTQARRSRVAAKAALGLLLADVQLRLIQFVLQRLPDAARLIEMGTGLDPLEWIHAAGPNTGAHAIVVECETSAQRANVEAQLDTAGIPHSHPLTAQQWWDQIGRVQFPGATEATWEIAEAFAAFHSTQLGRLINGGASVDTFRSLITGRATQIQGLRLEVES